LNRNTIACHSAAAAPPRSFAKFSSQSSMWIHFR
jgi:hypothetical protein